MDLPSHVAERPDREVWDVAVIGTGMGGATAGHELARRGRRVLFLERGGHPPDRRDAEGARRPRDDDGPEARLGRGRWPHPIEGRTSFGRVQFLEATGCGPGGTTRFYGAQLERFAPSDFRPRAHHPEAGDSTLPDAWPIGYDDLLPYYRRAEELFRVRGTPDPLLPDPLAPLREPPPLSERDESLYRSFRELGLHPYRSHVGIEYLDGCEECSGHPCPRACRNDAARICLSPALSEHGARIAVGCEVRRLDADRRSVTGLLCDLAGREAVIRARIVVLAAGAYMTPILLLNSRARDRPAGLANSSGLVGRNLMFHCSDFVAVKPRTVGATPGPKKGLTMNDFYVTARGKLGTLQSVGLALGPGYLLHRLREANRKDPRWWSPCARPFLRGVARATAYRLRGAAVFATILEDLPYLHNRVAPDADAASGLRFEYAYPDELRGRNAAFRELIADRLGGRHRVMFLTGPDNLNPAHACGTCRFGTDPARSVLDPSCRAHDLDNLFVVDGSVFPSSGGINPSLTIAANAMRVAEAIDAQLGGGVGRVGAV